MATRKGINISGHYIVSINATYCTFDICTLYSKNLKGRTESCFMLVLKRNHHPTRSYITSGYVEFIPTAVSSN